MCINGKVAQIRLFQWYSNPTGVIWPFPLCSYMSLEAGFLCDCTMCSKDFDFPFPAFKYQEPLQKESSLGVLSTNWKRQRWSECSPPRRSSTAVLHGGAWLDRSWGLPSTERAPARVPGCPPAGHTTAHLLSLLGTFVPMTPGVARRGQEPDNGGCAYRHLGSESPSALTKGCVASISS